MTLVEDIKRMIESALENAEFTSANPTHTNRLKQINAIDMPDLDAQLADTRPADIKQDKKVSDTIDAVDSFKEGNVGKIQQLTTQQIGNVTSFARNPFQFVIGSVFNKFTKGVGVAALATIIFEAVKVIVLELFKPGRVFDTQFRENIAQQIILFLERKEQQELKQGYKQVITTTIGGLRGDRLQGNIGGNFYNPDRIPVGFLDTRRVSENNIIAQDARNRSFTTVGVGAARSRR